MFKIGDNVEITGGFYMKKTYILKNGDGKKQ